MLALPATRSRLRRTLTATLGCVTAAVLLAVVPAGTAHAASSTTCTGTSHVTYSPGLTLTPQTVTTTETDTYTSCTSTDSTLTSGAIPTATYPLPNASCLDLRLPQGSSPLPLDWNNGQSSTATLTYELTSTAGVLQVIGTGTITSGEFTGATAVLTWIYALVNPLQCLAPGGLTTHNGTLIAQITGL
ncbi:hypothetical protein [Embleya sp. MST-111070]|uniref:hypothetical protein n=1 Tax=Embleya sp. MST-111070 TaxID=3398231 RepID=UPI003F73F25F